MNGVINKICFITYHNWITKRHGGFHKFAQAAVNRGIETIFFSFSRPYYIYWKHEERLNKDVLNTLRKGLIYQYEKAKLFNVTWPTLALPGPVRKFIPYNINKRLMTSSLYSFDKFKSKWLKGTDCFVFESCEAVLLAKKIKENFPNARIIYRPSDPLWEFSNDFFNIKGEREMIIIADKVLTVNEESIEGYKYKFQDIFEQSKFRCIYNGVDIKDYMCKYDKPEILKDCISACYIGAFLPDWNVLQKTAQALPEIRFIIITPHHLDEETNKMIESLDNLIYIDGISPTEVPKWITNCNVVIQPFPKEYGHVNKVSLGLTAQNYKAMAANKPIVTYNIPLKLSKYGLITTDNTEDFINGLRSAINIPKSLDLYSNFDIKSRDWDYLCEEFIKECEA